MRRKALIIGAETDGLSGVDNDVTVMSKILTDRGFAVDPRTGSDATQAGVRDGYARLIADAQPDDAVVVYFSGHGGLARVTSPGGTVLRELQFIVPTDYDQSSPGDFRGITDLELSVSLAQLTQRTHNVTVVLDCCHAAHMSRGLDLRVKALLHPSYLDVAEHRGMLRAQGLPVDLAAVEANPNAVRLVACASWESAYEYTNSNRLRTGLLTDSLRICLENAGGAKVTWSTLIQRIRTRVSTLAMSQRPEVEGPSGRLLFDTEHGRTGTALTVVRTTPDLLRLPGAALLGVAPGDQFGITPAGEAAATDSTMVARATVKRIDGVTVEAGFELCDGHLDLPLDAEAHPLVTSTARSDVLVCGGGPLVEQVRAAVDGAPTLRAIGPDDPAGNDSPIAKVVVEDVLALWDNGSEPLLSAPASQSGLDVILRSLGRLGRTASLRRLVPDASEALTDPFTVEWGLVVNGVAEPLPPSGTLRYAGESIYVRLRNGSTRNLFFFVFDLGVAGAVTLVTAADQSGLRVAPGQEYIVGDQNASGLKGTSLSWPSGIPTGEARPETLLLIVTDTQEDLAMLAHEGVVRAAPKGASPLRQALAIAGTTRDWPAADQPTARYAVTRLDFDLNPTPAPAPEAARFLIDERPDVSTRLMRARGSSGATGPRLAVRLTDLIVHRNRVLGGADIRVDALVLTGSEGGMPVYQARTVQYSNIRDDERLPLDNLLVYHGEAVDYLDIAWWVTRSRKERRALSDLLRDQLSAVDVQNALGSLLALGIGAPHAALAVATVSACSIIVDAAYDILSTMVGDAIGLYRTSLLASEGFGVGRHPTLGTRTAQDFSFAYEVIAAA